MIDSSSTPLILNTLSDKQLIKLLNNGAVGVLPTDTLYGLVCRAADQAAVKRLYKLKHREKKPGTVVAASIEQLVDLGLKARYLKVVEQYWPGPISIIIPCVDLSYVHLGVGSVPVRISADASLNKLLFSAGPLLTSSANQPGQPPANNLAEAQVYFDNQVDFYVDGGDLSNRPPSTIIRIVDDAIEIVRPGAVNINEAGRIIQ